VAPRNAVALVRQYLRLNGHPAVDSPGAPAAELPAADATSRHVDPGGRIVTTHDWRVGGRLVVRLVEIGGLGHAWSGGDPDYAYSDAHPPDATALIATFSREAQGP
jgi:poly(3-hydroxybutyrate) depolymerase